MSSLLSSLRHHLLIVPFCTFFFIKKILFEMQNDRERERSSLWFTSQMAATADPGTGWRQEPGPHPGLPRRWKGSRCLSCYLLLSKCTGGNLEQKWSDLDLNQHSDTDVTSQAALDPLHHNTCPHFCTFMYFVPLCLQLDISTPSVWKQVNVFWYLC